MAFMNNHDSSAANNGSTNNNSENNNYCLKKLLLNLSLLRFGKISKKDSKQTKWSDVTVKKINNRKGHQYKRIFGNPRSLFSYYNKTIRNLKTDKRQKQETFIIWTCKSNHPSDLFRQMFVKENRQLIDIVFTRYQFKRGRRYQKKWSICEALW